jgi:hypothetical protein
MDKSELVDFLKEHLRIEIHASETYIVDEHKLKVCLLLGDEIIDSSEATFVVDCDC